MKKISIFLFVLFFVVSCGEKSLDIEQAKKEMLNTSPEETITSQETSDTLSGSGNTSSDTQEEEEVLREPMVQITALTESQFIEISSIPDDSIGDGEVEITGKTLQNVEKIQVSFSNTDSAFPDDNYTLKTFKSGGPTFKYLASSKFQVLDFGVNTYIVKAYSGKEVSETQVVINVPKKDKVVFEEKVIGNEDNSVSLNLPTSDSFGKPLSLGQDSFTYTNIDNLEIVKKDVSEITCEGITDYLQTEINTWFYWNTCRDTIKDKGISFYVVLLGKDDTYIYQKHYVDFIHDFYGIYEVDRGTGVTKDNISEKNTKLKEINDTFENIDVVDSLMTTITAQK